MYLDSFMKELHRVLKPNGLHFILQNNRYGWWKYWGYYLKRNDRKYHFRTFSIWDIKRVLKKNGVFRIVCPDAKFLYEVATFKNEYWNRYRSHNWMGQDPKHWVNPKTKSP